MNSTFSAITGNWVCWAILALAFACYYQLGLRGQLGQRGQGRVGLTGAGGDARSTHTRVLIGALPLLGLFGTITGLLGCFAGMASGGGGEAVTGGIGKALFTTQLGLVCAVPAWVWLAWLDGREHPIEAGGDPVRGAERAVAP